MRLPLSWLTEYIDIKKEPQELAKLLTSIGLEVDAIESFTPEFERVVVGKVVKAEKHPNADSLQIASVTDGKELYQVVCGAANCRAGMKTAFCPVGATLPGDDGKPFKIKAAKIRGIESFGMLASAEELRLSEPDNGGIIELDSALDEGTDLRSLYHETVFEISLTPNLGHAASLVGIARELSAKLGIPYKIPLKKPKESAPSVESAVTVTVKDPQLAPRYAARVIKGVKVAPSPLWLQDKLIRSGLRPINNVVDVTNYLLLELGQPLHAFDLNEVKGKEVIVRKAKAGEKIRTLDGKEQQLGEEMLVIADKERALAIAGVMGGEASEVKAATTDILLESAFFDPRSIRRTAKKLALSTDASRRFERGADIGSVLLALDHAAALIQELAGGEVSQGFVDKLSQAVEPKKILLRKERTNQLLGLSLSASEIEEIFKRLGFPVRWKESSLLEVEVPTFRVDISGEVDLIEEVARLWGYDNIPRGTAHFSISGAEHAAMYLFEKSVRDKLVGLGLNEILTCDLIGPSEVSLLQEAGFPKGLIIEVVSPASVEQSLLRPSLLPGMLTVAKLNSDHQNQNMHIFEVGRVHFLSDGKYQDQSAAALLLTGLSRPHFWEDKPRLYDFFDLKGMVENFLTLLRIPAPQFLPGSLPLFHPGRQVKVMVGEETVGTFGELHPKTLRHFGLTERAFYAEFNLHDLLSLQKEREKMQPLALYPSSLRDWTITLSDSCETRTLFDAIHKVKAPLLEAADLLDIWRSERIGKGKYNATVRFVYRDRTKTLSQEEVDKAHAFLTEETLKNLGKAVI